MQFTCTVAISRCILFAVLEIAKCTNCPHLCVWLQQHDVALQRPRSLSADMPSFSRWADRNVDASGLAGLLATGSNPGAPKAPVLPVSDIPLVGFAGATALRAQPVIISYSYFHEDQSMRRAQTFAAWAEAQQRWGNELKCVTCSPRLLQHCTGCSRLIASGTVVCKSQDARCA